MRMSLHKLDHTTSLQTRHLDRSARRRAPTHTRFWNGLLLAEVAPPDELAEEADVRDVIRPERHEEVQEPAQLVPFACDRPGFRLTHRSYKGAS
jgi:hypothetical protein